jgi:hypothetical protein
MTEIYKPTPAGLPGNDDLGATSAWYVWGALGLYPAIPGVGGFVITSPLFPSATIRLGDGHTLQIKTQSTSPDAVYIQQLTLNGASDTRAWLPVASIKANRTIMLDFTLATQPDTGWGTRAADAPPSFTARQAPVICFIRGEDAIALPPGDSATLTLGVRRLESDALKLSWHALAPSGLQLQPATGVIELGADRAPDIHLQVSAASQLPPGRYVVPIKLQANGRAPTRNVELPEVVLEIRVGAAGTSSIK